MVAILSIRACSSPPSSSQTAPAAQPGVPSPHHSVHPRAEYPITGVPVFLSCFVFGGFIFRELSTCISLHAVSLSRRVVTARSLLGRSFLSYPRQQFSSLARHFISTILVRTTSRASHIISLSSPLLQSSRFCRPYLMPEHFSFLAHVPHLKYYS